jgi:hypothetical protein
MAAGDSSPFRRTPETLLERRGVRDGVEAVPHSVRGKVDVHNVPGLEMIHRDHAMLAPDSAKTAEGRVAYR